MTDNTLNTPFNAETKLKALFWNCQGIRSKKPELIDFIATHSINMVFLSETYLSEKHRFSIPGFTIYRKHAHKVRRWHGGVALLIKQNLQQHEVVVPALSTIQAVAASVTVSNKPIVFISVYCPNQTLSMNDIDTLASISQTFFLAGDLNAKNVQWGCRTTNKWHKTVQP